MKPTALPGASKPKRWIQVSWCALMNEARTLPYPLVCSIPKGACWLNLQEGWWRLFRRDAFAGQSFANAHEIERCRSLRRNSTTEPNPGSGDGLPERGATCIVSFVTAFEECSSRVKPLP
nr:hypothetical protein [Ktedonobacter sp. SOSP1-85]